MEIRSADTGSGEERKVARAIVEYICRGTNLVEHGHEQVVQRRIFRVLDMTTGANQPATSPG